MDYAAGASGATLGYIMGNVPGAILGYKTAKKLSQNSKRMAPVRRNSMPPPRTPQATSRTRRASVAFTPTSNVRNVRQRRNSDGAGYYNRSIIASAMGNVVRGRSGTSNAAFVGKRNKRKGVSMKKKKSIKVSRKFKKQVRKALEPSTIRGYYQKTSYARLARPDSNTQRVEDLGMFFTPVKFAEAIQTLFSNQAPVEIPINASITQTNIFQSKLHVRNSWVTFEVKNSGQRTVHLEFNQCKPKSINNVNTAVNDWNGGLQLMNTNLQNPQNITANTLYSHPNLSAQFSKYWGLESQKVTLGPGQTYKYTVQGPADFDMDFNRMYQKVTVATPELAVNQKFARNVHFVYYYDMVQTTLGVVGRNVDTPAVYGGLSVEYNQYFDINCPETIGFVFPTAPAAGQIITLGLRRDVVVIKNFGSTGDVGGVVDVLEENPIGVVSGPLS